MDISAESGIDRFRLFPLARPVIDSITRGNRLTGSAVDFARETRVSNLNLSVMFNSVAISILRRAGKDPLVLGMPNGYGYDSPGSILIRITT